MAKKPRKKPAPRLADAVQPPDQGAISPEVAERLQAVPTMTPKQASIAFQLMGQIRGVSVDEALTVVGPIKDQLLAIAAGFHVISRAKGGGQEKGVGAKDTGKAPPYSPPASGKDKRQPAAVKDHE